MGTWLLAATTVLLLTLASSHAQPQTQSPLCEAQDLCTCWTNATATQVPACYSLAIYTCPGGNKLVAGPEPTGRCSIPRADALTALSPNPAPVTAPPPPPPPTPVNPSLRPAHVCEAQDLCTCWSNATATQPPACYSPTRYNCPSGTALLVGTEPTGHCSISRSAPSASPAVSRPPAPSAAAALPVAAPSPAPASVQTRASAAARNMPGGPLGTLVTPVAGTLTADGLPATAASLPPFGRLDNTKTTRLIRMPSPGQDVNGLLLRPVPTSAWWTNIMWGGPSTSPTYGEDPVQVFPYHLRLRGPPSPSTPAVDRGLWVCKPFYTGDNEGGVIMATWPELQVTLREIQAAAAPSITAVDWDQLSLTLEHSAGSSSSSGGGGPAASLRMPLVQGSPYVSVQVPTPGQPVIRAPGNGGGVISSVTQVSPSKLRVLVGGVPGGEGTHTFLLWASEPVSYTLLADSIQISGSGAASDGKFSGWLRLAWVPNTAAGADSIEAMLDRHVDAVPVGGSVKAWSNMTAGTTSYSLSWSTQSMTGAAAAAATAPQLLMLALPHHIDTLVVDVSMQAGAAAACSGAAAGSAAVSFPLGLAPAGTGTPAGLGSIAVYSSTPAQGAGRASADYGAYVMTVRGPQVPVLGSCWVLQDQAVELVGELQAAANLRNPAWRKEIEEALLADLQLALPPSTGDPFAAWPGGWPWKGLMNLDVYFGGSEMQAMAQLIHIAKALEQTSTAAGSSFSLSAAAAAANVTHALGLLLQHKLTLPCSADGANPGALCYDGVFKTITTARALRNEDDGMDFFSRTGTDHHFHYGYWVAAAAAVASQDLGWYKAHLEPAVKSLTRDFANNDKSDPVLPFCRHKDWYMGHSWAAGLQTSVDGKNQESSSEAVNAYAGIVALGRATGDAVLEGWGQVLLSSEVRAARKYTQVYAGNDLYLQIAGGSSGNGVSRAKVATILFAAKASTFNFFDADILTRHAIQWMPFGPATPALLPPAWLRESVPLVQAGTKMPTNRYWSWEDQGGGAALGWRVLLAMAQSMLPGQQAAAWEALKSLPLDASEGFALCGTIGRLTRTAAKWWIATRPLPS